MGYVGEGTAGEVLTSNGGSGAGVAWAPASSGGTPIVQTVSFGNSSDANEPALIQNGEILLGAFLATTNEQLTNVAAFVQQPGVGDIAILVMDSTLGAGNGTVLASHTVTGPVGTGIIGGALTSPVTLVRGNLYYLGLQPSQTSSAHLFRGSIAGNGPANTDPKPNGTVAPAGGFPATNITVENINFTNGLCPWIALF